MSESNGTRYFIKELVSNTVRLSSGRRIPWEDIGDDMGALATNDPVLVRDLQEASLRGIGGITEVGAQQFEDAKKKSAAEESRKISLSIQNRRFDQSRVVDGGAARAAVANPQQQPVQPKVETSPAGEPIHVPKEVPVPKPPSRRRSVVKTVEPVAATAEATAST